MKTVTSDRVAWTAIVPGSKASPLRYIAMPSREHPLLVASRDPDVLRYLADSVLSVPPGARAVPSFVLTVVLRLLRYRSVWMLASLVLAAGLALERLTG